MHWLAVTADMSKIAAFRRDSYVKKRGLRMKQEGITGVGPSVEQSTVGTLDIDIRHCRFPASAKKN
jgi:hypothetical protein